MTFSTRRLIKEGISCAAEGTGLLRRFHHGRVLFLLYHRVLPDDELSRIQVARSTLVSCTAFEQNLQYLRREYEPLSLASFLERLKANDWDPRRRYVVLTFDDGWADNYYHAWPLLKQYEWPATIFLATGLIDTDWPFWWEDLGRLMAWIFAEPDRLEGVRPVLASFLGAVPQGTAVDAWIEQAKALPFPRIEELISVLSSKAKRPAPPPSALSWAQIEEMSSHGLVRFGPHTVHHALLTRLPPAEAGLEIEGSLEALRARSRVAWDSVFSYPGGAYSDAVVEQVRQAGCAAALTVGSGVNPCPPPDPFRLRRINIDGPSASSPGMFKYRLFQGTLAGYAKSHASGMA